MAQRLKRWESPRNEGRNDKGRGGSARQRQKQKQMRMLKQKLKQNNAEGNGNAEGGKKEGRNKFVSPLFFYAFLIDLLQIEVPGLGLLGAAPPVDLICERFNEWRDR